MTCVGGIRPPAPIIMGAGREPLLKRVIVGLPPIWVVERLPVLTPPGVNSLTVPVTVMESPTLTVGALLVNTKMASDVAMLVSGLGSWR